ncbi:PaaI family thioesterase [Nannocystis sp. SCPEA4]|uniref:PaaI family thioesterase n=1 Tax=Nannocystis sp. SCPEA4 TaxID=2996787 RepID=UPI00226E0F10|nr:PaaI family thioesterase [Nannocystis sp. SCPEA4]MCY1061559.1 PaaI family thioesterase [Nannocystis sp. SCPEA4]
MNLARTRTITWDDPFAAARAGAERSGLAYLQAIATGALPQFPIGAVLDMRIHEAAHGRVLVVCTPSEFHYNIIGTVHGGLAASMIDSASGCAVLSTLALGDSWTTIDLSVDYLLPITRESGVLSCEGRVVRSGRRVGLADAELRDGAGRLLARGSSTCLLTRAGE